MSKNRDNELLGEEYSAKIALQQEALGGLEQMIPSAQELAEMLKETFPFLVGGAAFKIALWFEDFLKKRKEGTPPNVGGSSTPPPADTTSPHSKVPTFIRKPPTNP
jgi:hypothetical protein